jgi:hypothetical protein
MSLPSDSAYVGRNAARERERELRQLGHWASAVRHLDLAKGFLQWTPRPWAHDCVSESIEKIEDPWRAFAYGRGIVCCGVAVGGVPLVCA